MEDEIKKCKNYILRLLTYRPYSRYEVEQKLRKKEYAEEVIAISLDDLERVGLINDLEFANAWIYSRMRHRPRGRWLLERELRQKGVSDKNIAKAMSDFDEEYDEFQIAHRLAEKRMRRYQQIDPMKARRRVFSFLKRRGFSYEVIRSVFDDLFEEF